MSVNFCKYDDFKDYSEVYEYFLFFHRMLNYFLWFLDKTSSLVFFYSHARKYMRTQSSTILSLFQDQQGYMKKEPPGVLFKLFSDSLNMKRLPSDLVIFTLIKVFEESICWAIIYLVFSLIRLFYKKGTERVLF